MEQNIAILMADLSGYTALTETHGPQMAADLIDKYLGIVKKCLVGDCHLHQRTGDEVMIVSPTTSDLLSTATLLLQHASNEHNFLQVHGGLHYGKILNRDNDYYGTTINLTSRIANKAKSGAFWCSKDFVTTLPDKYASIFQSQGHHSFKNLSSECELFEITFDNPKSFYVDPICRMLVHKEKAAVPHPTVNDIFFCSPDCRDIFISVK